MSLTIKAGARTGLVRIPSSKSELHRLLILAALGEKPVTIRKRGVSEDIQATARCLTALGARISEEAEALAVEPIPRAEGRLQASASDAPLSLPVGESGTTLRLLLPLAGLLGTSVCFVREGRLAERPLEPFASELARHGMRFREEGDLLYAEGSLGGGMYRLPGNVSSQYVSALLLILPLLKEDSVLRIDWPLESAPYVRLTEWTLEAAGIKLERTELSRPAPKGADGGPLSLVFDPLYWIGGGQIPQLPADFRAGGDYSGAAAFFCMGALSPTGIVVEGLDPESVQGDKAILDILARMGAEVASQNGLTAVRGGKLRGGIFNLADTPDLAPVLAMVAANAEGNTLFRGAGRLRLKESDRLEGIAEMLKALGIQAETKQDAILIYGGKLKGGEVKTLSDHRLAMAAAVAACGADDNVSLDNEGCVAKSYTAFWKDFAELKLG